MNNTTPFPELTPQDLEEIEQQGNKIVRPEERAMYHYPPGIDASTPRLQSRPPYNHGTLSYHIPGEGTLEVDTPTFHHVLAQFLLSKGMTKKTYHELMLEWQRQQVEAAKLEMALDFWKRYPARGVRFYPDTSSRKE